LNQVFGVALIHDGEVARQPRLRAELAKQAMAGRVERPTLNARRRGSHESFGSAQHLVRGAARKRQQQDTLGSNAAVQQVSDPVDERSSFTRACAGDDEEGSVAMRGGGELLGVQLCGKVPPGSGDASLSRWRDAGFCHARNIGSGDLRGREPFRVTPVPFSASFTRYTGPVRESRACSRVIPDRFALREPLRFSRSLVRLLEQAWLGDEWPLTVVHLYGHFRKTSNANADGELSLTPLTLRPILGRLPYFHVQCRKSEEIPRLFGRSAAL